MLLKVACVTFIHYSEMSHISKLDQVMGPVTNQGDTTAIMSPYEDKTGTKREYAKVVR